MSNITDRAPRRIPEWLSLQDISRAWNEETGEEAAVFEAGFRGWFKDYLVRNAYGGASADGEGEDAGVMAQLLEGRQIWRETFESFCEERGLTKPRFWFPEGGRPVPVSEPAASDPAPIAEVETASPSASPSANPSASPAVDPAAEAPKPPSRQRVREGSKSFTWIAAGLVVAVAAGSLMLWRRDLAAPVADGGLVSGAVAIAKSAISAPADLAPIDPVPTPAASTVTGDSATVATPAPTTVSDPAAAQMAAARISADRIDIAAASPAQILTAGTAMVEEVVDPGLVLLLQRELQAAGYDPGPLDGLPGPRITAAIASYQRANNLSADGRVTIAMLSRLASENLKAGRKVPNAATAPAAGVAMAAPETAARDSGSTLQFPAPAREPAPRGRELVRAIQKRLADRGYYNGPLDGSLGPKTRQAIQAYQRVQRYDATGRPSRKIYEDLEDHALEVQGLDQFRKGAYDAAVVTYSRIIRRAPKNADAHFNRGLAHKNVGRTDLALSDYEVAIALDPAHRQAYFDRANILYDRGLYRNAFRAYFKALKLLLNFS